MKTIAALVTVTLITLPTIASATYVCDKRWAEMHGASCPAGSVWDSSQHACMSTGS